MPPLDAEGNLKIDEVDQVEAADVLDVLCVFYSRFFFDDDNDVDLILSDVDLDVEPVDVVGKVLEYDKVTVLNVDDDVF